MKAKLIANLGTLALLLVSCGGGGQLEPEPSKPEEVKVSSVSVSPSSLDLHIGESSTLQATVSPADAKDKTVSWTSSNASVASVSSDGVVTANAEGNATITATAGGKSGSCSVTVSKPVVEVQSISLNETSLSLVEGETATLVATVKPDDATDKSVSWSSSNPEIASVDNSGKVTAIKAGNATIRAKAGGKSVTCEVTVEAKYVAVESVTLDKSELALMKGQTKTLKATVTPDDATNKTVSWLSSNEAVATVSQEGLVTATGGGEAVITAKVEDISATCKVTVTVPVESVTLDHTELSIVKGNTAQLVATVNPDDASDKTVSWSSSNNSIATVDENGLVTAKDKGTATITVNASGKTATCQVTVTIPAESISLNASSVTLVVGQTYELTAVVSPSYSTDKVEWGSSDSSIIQVDDYGQVKAIKEGEAVITAKAGDKSATCSFKVNAATGDNEGIGYDEW